MKNVRVRPETWSRCSSSFRAWPVGTAGPSHSRCESTSDAPSITPLAGDDGARSVAGTCQQAAVDCLPALVRFAAPGGRIFGDLSVVGAVFGMAGRGHLQCGFQAGEGLQAVDLAGLDLRGDAAPGAPAMIVTGEWRALAISGCWARETRPQAVPVVAGLGRLLAEAGLGRDAHGNRSRQAGHRRRKPWSRGPEPKESRFSPRRDPGPATGLWFHP